MHHPIRDPPVPFVGPIPGGFCPGTIIRIQGQVPPTADRFNINLHCGPPPSDIALHLSVRLLQNYVARNTLKAGVWGNEEDNGSLTIAPGQSFEILILCDPDSYKVAVNGCHFCEFRHRIPFQQVTDMGIDGEVTLKLIAFEGASAPAAPPMAEGPDFAYNMPPGQYGPPPQGHYGSPPQGQYGPPPYGGGPPRPPGHQEESGMDNFLETASTLIAGAIGSGAAQNLFSSITGSGGQAQHPQQQQHYQPPPPPPPQPQQPLFSLGGQGSMGGLGSVGSLLQTFAGQVLSGPKKLPISMPTPASASLGQPPPISMPMPSSVPMPSAYPGAVPPPLPGQPAMPTPYAPAYSYPFSYIPGSAPAYIPKKMKKSKLKKAMKYGLPIAGAGLGAYALSHAIRHHGSSSSSSSSSNDSN